MFFFIMDRKDAPLLIAIILITAFGGGMIGYNAAPNPVIKITSIADGSEIHSIVPLDAVFDKGDEVGVWINGTKMSSVLPYYWNNMLYPAGDYDVSVGVLKNGKWTYDNITLTIPKEFIVPKDYEFAEDFVVHEGQTVIMEGKFSVSSKDISNGWNSIDEHIYYDINVYGILYLNASVKCATFLCEDNSKMYYYGSNITLMEKNYLDYNGGYFGPNIVRFDDNAVLYTDQPYIVDLSSKNDYNVDLIKFATTPWFLFAEGSSLLAL